jgi:hypothetical protein
MNPQDYNSSEVDKPTSIKINIKNWKIRNHIRKGDKVRLTVNLDKDQSVAWKNFKQFCQPKDLSDDEFLKVVFLTGVEAMNNELIRLIKEYKKENSDELAASGITIVEEEDGNITISETDDKE